MGVPNRRITVAATASLVDTLMWRLAREIVRRDLGSREEFAVVDSGERDNH